VSNTESGAAGKTAVTNVRVFGGRELRPPGTVVIDGDRIGSDPAGAQVIDGRSAVSGAAGSSVFH